MNTPDWQITNTTLMLPDSVRKLSGCIISNGMTNRILESTESEDNMITLNLHGFHMFPGLINGHDTLMATYHDFPGKNKPYLNWLAFDNELKASDLFKERMLLDIEQLYMLGAYRNILGGTTTVVDHIPQFVRNPFQKKLPVHLLENFGISHSICSYSLNWGDGIRKEYEQSVNNNLPYITHIAEGFDPESKNSLKRLSEYNALSEHTVLVHGLGLSDEDFELMAESGSHMVWCPSSNQYLYDNTARIKEILDRDINVCLGTDFAMTGSINILEELKYARKYYQEQYNEPLSNQVLYNMVTRNPSRALRIPERGRISSGNPADFLVLKVKYPDDPYRSLIEAEMHEIYLITENGIPVFGETGLEIIFNELDIAFENIIINGTHKLIIKGLKELLENIWAATSNYDEFKFLPVKFN